MASKAEEWSRHIESWKRSGLTQSEYCRQNKLLITSLSKWKLKLAALPQNPKSSTSTDPEIPIFISAPAPTELIPVAISEQTESQPTTDHLDQAKNSGVSLIIKNGLQISLDIGFDPSTLKSVLTTLEE